MAAERIGLYSLKAALPVAIEGEEAVEGLLGGVHFREGGSDAGTSAGSTRRRIDIGDLLDSGEGLQEAGQAQRETVLRRLAVEQAAEDQGEDAIEGMDADLGIGPVEHGLPTEEVGIFHFGKGLLHLGLAAIGEHDLLIGPALLVGEQDALSELGFSDSRPSGGVRAVGQPQATAALADRSAEDLGDVLAGADLLEVLGQAFPGVALALGMGFLRAVQFGLQLLQGAPFFGQVLFHAAELLALQLGAEGEEQGALLAPNFSAEAEGQGGLEAGIVEGPELAEGNGQQVGVVGGYQRAHEVEAAGVEDLLIAGGVVALVEDQGDGLAVARQGAIAVGEFLQDLGKGEAIVLVARVDLPEQGDMKIDADQQSQADDAQIGALAFGMTALGELAGGGGVDEGVEVGTVKHQAAQIQPEGFHDALGQGLADGGDLGFCEQFHVVPEALGGKLARDHAQPGGQGGGAKPSGHLQFAGGGHAAVQGGDQHVLTEGGALLAFGGELIDELDQAELLGEVVEGGQGAEGSHAGAAGSDGRLAQALQQGVGGAEVFDDHGTRAAVHAARLDEVVIGVPVNDLALEAGHNYFSVYTSSSGGQAKSATCGMAVRWL